MENSIFDKLKKVKEAFKEVKEESKFSYVRIPLIEFIGKKDDVDTDSLSCTMHLEKDTHFIKVSFDVYFTKDGKAYKASNNKLSQDLFEDCGMPQYIIDELNKSNKCDVALTFKDLQQLYDEMKIEIINKLSYNKIFEQCKKEYDSIEVIDRVFYTRLEYYNNNQMVEQVHVGLITDVPSVDYSEFYPFKTKRINKQ